MQHMWLAQGSRTAGCTLHVNSAAGTHRLTALPSAAAAAICSAIAGLGLVGTTPLALHASHLPAAWRGHGQRRSGTKPRLAAAGFLAGLCTANSAPVAHSPHSPGDEGASITTKAGTETAPFGCACWWSWAGRTSTTTALPSSDMSKASSAATVCTPAAVSCA